MQSTIVAFLKPGQYIRLALNREARLLSQQGASITLAKILDEDDRGLLLLPYINSDSHETQPPVFIAWHAIDAIEGAEAPASAPEPSA